MTERKYRHPQVNLRLPENLKEKIVAIANKNGRSANAEMVAAIEAWVENSENRLAPIDTLSDLTKQLEAISQRISALENKKPT